MSWKGNKERERFNLKNITKNQKTTKTTRLLQCITVFTKIQIKAKDKREREREREKERRKKKRQKREAKRKRQKEKGKKRERERKRESKILKRKERIKNT